MQKMDHYAASGPGPKRPVFDLGAYLHLLLLSMSWARSLSAEASASWPRVGTLRTPSSTIDNSQTYNGIVGQIPEIDHLLRRNPLWQYIPWMSTKNALITKMALEEMDHRRPFDKDSAGLLRSGDGRQDLMASLIQGHLKDPERFREGDVFAVAHGAM